MVRNGSIRPGASGWAYCVGDDPAYPVELRERLSRLAADPSRFTTQWSFTKSEFADAEQVVNLKRHYGTLPLIVLTAADTPDLPLAVAPAATTTEMKRTQVELWTKAHDRLAKLSSRGKNVIVAGSMHYIQLMQPGSVNSAVKHVVAEARKATR